MRPFITLLFTAAALLAEDYKAAPGGAPPAELAASVSALLHKEGTRVMKDGQLLAEVWYRSEVPAGPASAEANLTMPNVPHGSLLAVIQFAQKHEDRRGQTVHRKDLMQKRVAYLAASLVRSQPAKPATCVSAHTPACNAMCRRCTKTTSSCC